MRTVPLSCQVSVEDIYGATLPATPKGYEVTGFALPGPQDLWLAIITGKVLGEPGDVRPRGPRLLLRKLPEPRKRYVVEFPFSISNPIQGRHLGSADVIRELKPLSREQVNSIDYAWRDSLAQVLRDLGIDVEPDA